MRTGRSLTVCQSLLLGRGGAWIWSPSISPLGVGLDLIPLNSPLGCGPGSDPPQFPPWVWVWIWSPSIPPLGVGLDLIPLNFPLGCGPGSDPLQFPPWVWAWIWSPSISPLGVGLEGVSLAGGSPSRRGVPPSQGMVSQHALRQTLPPWTEWQTGVKILPWPPLCCGR